MKPEVEDAENLLQNFFNQFSQAVTTNQDCVAFAPKIDTAQQIQDFPRELLHLYDEEAKDDLDAIKTSFTIKDGADSKQHTLDDTSVSSVPEGNTASKKYSVKFKTRKKKRFCSCLLSMCSPCIVRKRSAAQDDVSDGNTEPTRGLVAPDAPVIRGIHLGEPVEVTTETDSLKSWEDYKEKVRDSIAERIREIGDLYNPQVVGLANDLAATATKPVSEKLSRLRKLLIDCADHLQPLYPQQISTALGLPAPAAQSRLLTSSYSAFQYSLDRVIENDHSAQNMALVWLLCRNSLSTGSNPFGCRYMFSRFQNWITSRGGWNSALEKVKESPVD